MDAVHFGRWISDRRRKCGWRSQRSLVESIRQDPLLKDEGISEDFLARLEAGQLAQPFRGSVRRRVLVLARQLCKTLRDLQTYLQAAELTQLNAAEEDYVNRLKERLTTRHSSTLLLLPPRPLRLVGRATAVQELTQALCTIETGVCSVTGMLGVGKSVLAYEAVHQIATNQSEHFFPDGIAAFKCTGRSGVSGLRALLNDIIAVFASPMPSSSKVKRASAINIDRVGPSTHHTDNAPYHAASAFRDDDLAGMIDRVRIVLAGKRILLILDDLDAQFPLRQALEALLMQEQKHPTGRGGSVTGYTSRVILITSRFVPAPALIAYHLHLGPLEPDAALELFTDLVGHPLSSEEHACAERICAAIGYLPLAIEAAASTTSIAGIPLSLLAERITEYPLDRLLDSDGELHATLAQALADLDPEMQKRFVLLSALGTPSFGLESVAALHTAHLAPERDESLLTALSPLQTMSNIGRDVGIDTSVPIALSPFDWESKTHHGTTPSTLDIPLAQLADTAADLGQFTRHSLVELVPHPLQTTGPLSNQRPLNNHPRYRLHPLLYTYAMERLEQLEPEIVHGAQRNVQEYALAYIEQYFGDIERCEREREFLLAALAGAWQQQQYPLVVRLLRRLLRLISRLGNYEYGESFLHWGIHACQYLQDRHSQALFLSCLGRLLNRRGQLMQARSVLETSLAIAESLDHPVHLWDPLAELAHIAYALDEHDAALRFAETFLQHSQSGNDPIAMASGLYLSGFYRRQSGDMDKANNHLQTCLHLFPLQSGICFCEDTFVMLARAEHARIQADYTRSQAYTEAAVPLAQSTEDPYIVADLLFDQACFAYQQGILDDVRALTQRVIDMAAHIGASHLYTRGMTLLQQLPDA